MISVSLNRRQVPPEPPSFPTTNGNPRHEKTCFLWDGHQYPLETGFVSFVKRLETLVPDDPHLVADEGHRLDPPAAMIRVMTDSTARSTEGHGGMTDRHVRDAVAGTVLIECRSPARTRGFAPIGILERISVSCRLS